MRWQRVLGWSTLALVTAVGGCTLLLSQLLPDDLCDTEIFFKTVSPDGRHTAIVYETDCGATTGFSRQVAVMATPERRIEPSALPRGFLAISLGSAVDSRLSMRDSLVRLHWRSNDQLEIAYPAGSRLIRSTDRSEGVEMTYRTYRDSPTTP